MRSEGLVLVTGGTGNLGRRVVARLREEGREVRVVSRHPKQQVEGVEYVAADLARDGGVEAAVSGAKVVVHCAGSPKLEDEAAMARSVAHAALAAGAEHLLNISVVGADRIPVESRLDHSMFGYFAAQLAGEREIAASGVPWTTLRATQFHDGFILFMVRAMAKLPVVPVPSGLRFQPVDADEVADRMVELALAEPAGHAPDLAGPRVYEARDLLRGYLKAVRKRRLLVPVRLPGAAARAIRAGANLAPERAVGRRTWEEFLAQLASSEAEAAAAPRPA